jgi:hypothetical protein
MSDEFMQKNWIQMLNQKKKDEQIMNIAFLKQLLNAYAQGDEDAAKQIERIQKILGTKS